MLTGMLGEYAAATALLLLVAPVVFLAAWQDLKEFHISNRLQIAGLAIFFVGCLFLLPLAEIPWRLLGGLIVFVIGLALFSLKAMGGGDAKLLTVLALFVPANEAHIALLALATGAIASLVLMGVIVLMRHFSLTLDSPSLGKVKEWEVWSGAFHVPYGAAIASGYTLYVAIRILGGGAPIGG